MAAAQVAQVAQTAHAAQRTNRHRLLLKYPASWWNHMWREALPAGNGRIGASVFGAVKEETVLLHHHELWHWGCRQELPDVSHTLAETRRLMDEGRYSEASWHLTNALKEQGYATKLASRFPLGAMRLSMPAAHAFRHYRRELDMETGEIEVRWKDGEQIKRRRLFVSRADDCVVMEIIVTSPADQPRLEGEVSLILQPSDRLANDAAYQELAQSVSVRTSGSYVYYAARNDDGQDFGAVLRLVTEEAKHNSGQVASARVSPPQAVPAQVVPAQAGSTQAVLAQAGPAQAVPAQAAPTQSAPASVSASMGTDGKLSFSSSHRVLLLIKLFTGGSREQEWERLQRELAGITDDYETLLARHAALHRPLFHTSSLDIDDAGDDDRSNEQLLFEAYEGEAPTGLVRKLWEYGRYLFISGTSADSQPFGLYGLWCGDYLLPWTHNMANENIQMMYWHAGVGGLSELTPSLFRYYNGLMDDFRENARRLYGCRGIYIPAGTTPGSGVPNQIVPVIMNWTGAAGWLARHYYEYFQFTCDKQFLTETALPFMTAALQFYEDFLVLDENGFYRIYPSVSPENTPQNFMPPDGQQIAHPMPTTISATMDIAILKELLTNVIEGSRLVGVNSGDIPRWEKMLTRIPPYQINEDGSIREWMHPAFDDRRDHRHLSHIYPVFPGQEVTSESHPEWFQAFDIAVRQRLLGAQSGWSLAHMASIYARLGDGEQALESLNILTRACLMNNLFTLHNDWRNMGICMEMASAPVQLDANMGWVNAVQEMLLFVSAREIRILPALPSKWKTGAVRDWRIHGGRISFAWNLPKGAFTLELTAEWPISADIRLPDLFTDYTYTKGGAAKSSPVLPGILVPFTLVAGEGLMIRNGIR
ncbi:glycosyl hydrolase family 95 catalytic domain-containing protein [Paenibacillus jiagnxiensis]|uniref:glycosyl hydrolase family 95 catalytic domain-containing protein n=1 Tax=Paenibacillus jiagnxiensis TaxID=3228926 RepID=UPI0033A773FD